MTEQEIRIECLRLAIPKDLSNPDNAKIVERAKVFEAYVVGDGHAKAPSLSLPVQPHKTGQGQHNGPRHQQR